MFDTVEHHRKNSGPKDWPEDYDDDNGMYTNICYICRHEFMGMKRRICCKECSNKHVESKV